MGIEMKVLEVTEFDPYINLCEISKLSDMRGGVRSFKFSKYNVGIICQVLKVT